MVDPLPYASPNPQIKKDDLYFLKVISICHYVWGGGLVLGCLMVLYNVETDPNERWVLFALLAYGILAAASGYFMHVRQFRVLSLVVAALTCLSVPIGTILGVSTIVILQRQSIQASYGEI